MLRPIHQARGDGIEQLDVPFEDHAVPAIFSLPLNYKPGDKLPCVVIIFGMDGWKELSVAMDGDKWLQRGFAVLAIDGPGQGESLTRGIWFDPSNYGKLGTSAYEFAAARPEVLEKIVCTDSASGRIGLPLSLRASRDFSTAVLP